MWWSEQENVKRERESEAGNNNSYCHCCCWAGLFPLNRQRRAVSRVHRLEPALANSSARLSDLSANPRRASRDGECPGRVGCPARNEPHVKARQFTKREGNSRKYPPPKLPCVLSDWPTHNTRC
ncbi:hypothetical protein ElyMa_006435500 [Elysia marginata]|uniref:Uncharacterized protein n=1 Tax=Elysia marginata TaxID=1093978 RepID=A0AAV4HZ45_9GAST|nr:hypothetical protein ElyMa_006435500 [Elysia marginata]